MLMRLLCMTLLMLPASGCGTETPRPVEPQGPPAICDGSRAARAALAEVLAETQDERALMAGANLIDILDAGCAV